MSCLIRICVELKVALDEFLELGFVRARERRDELAVLEELECGHTGNILAVRKLRKLVHVDVDERGVSVLRAERLELGCDALARSAPLRGEIDNNLVHAVSTRKRENTQRLFSQENRARKNSRVEITKPALALSLLYSSLSCTW